MKIKIAIIPKARVSHAKELSENLRHAVEVGEMAIVDSLTQELIEMSDKDHAVSMSEESWTNMICLIRNSKPDFRSDYLLFELELKTIISADVSELVEDVSIICEYALKADDIVLQLPYEEDVDV